MAEVLSSAIQFLYPLITAELSLKSGLPDEVAAICNELNFIQLFLKNEEERADEDDSVKEWVRQLRTSAHEIEDVIEEYKLSQKENKLIDKFKRFVPLHMRTIAIAIKSLQQKAVIIGRRREQYRFDNVNQQAGQHQSTILSVGMTEESELVGAETAKRDLIEKLGLQDFEEDSRITTIAVIGMRGLGKTTVVGSVYNDETVRDYFPIRAWVHVPRPPYNHVDILRDMLKQFNEAARELGEFRNDANNSRTYPTLEGINSMDQRSLLCQLRKL